MFFLQTCSLAVLVSFWIRDEFLLTLRRSCNVNYVYCKPYCCVIVSPFAVRCYNIWVMLDEVLYFSELFCLFVKILFHTKIFERFKLSLTYLICHCQVDPKVIKVPNWQWQRMIERIFQIEVDNRVSPALVRKSPIFVMRSAVGCSKG